MVTTLLNQKTHIIYGVIIILIASVAYHFFKKDPEKIVTTLTKIVTQVKTVEQIVTKDKIVYVDRTITTHKKDGDIIVEVDHEHDAIVTHSDTKSTQKVIESVTKQTVTTFMKNYSLEVMFPIYNNSFALNTNPLDTQLSVGTRIFSSPLWLVVGTNFHFNQLLIGARTEF